MAVAGSDVKRGWRSRCIRLVALANEFSRARCNMDASTVSGPNELQLGKSARLMHTSERIATKMVATCL